AAIVVPLAWRSIASTVSCFVGEPPLGSATACTAALGFDFRAVVFLGRAGFDARLIPRGGLAARLANFDFCLLAIRPSLSQRQHHVLPLARAPRSGRATGGRRSPCDDAPQCHHTRSS